MSLIDKTYFVLDINVPDGTHSQLAAYITRYEKEVLMRLLTPDLYDLVAAYDSGTSEQRIKDLVEGKDYTVDGYTVRWNGLINSDKSSLISFYVYYHYVKSLASLLMPVGNVKPSQENSGRADVSQKLQTAWHSFRELAGYPGQPLLRPSLYNFLAEHEDDYPEWEVETVEHFGNINAFDI